LEALLQPRPAVALDRGAVGLVEAGLEHIGQAEVGAGRLQLAAHRQRQVDSLQHIESGDHGQGLAFADADVPAREMDDGHGSSGVVLGRRTSGARRRLTQGSKINTCLASPSVALRAFRMNTARSVVDAIGDTPLIRLRRASDMTGCEIWAKAEFMNPGQSVKDRAALYIVRDAEKRGLLRPGGTIVEGTAGNTGIGLAMVGAALGYRTVIVIPRTQSQEKKDAIRLLGAELVEVDAVPYSNPDNYVRYSGRLAEEKAKTEPNGAIWANQFDNVANREAHLYTTGP